MPNRAPTCALSRPGKSQRHVRAARSRRVKPAPARLQRALFLADHFLCARKSPLRPAQVGRLPGTPLSLGASDPLAHHPGNWNPARAAGKGRPTPERAAPRSAGRWCIEQPNSPTREPGATGDPGGGTRKARSVPRSGSGSFVRQMAASDFRYRRTRKSPLVLTLRMERAAFSHLPLEGGGIGGLRPPLNNADAEHRLWSVAGREPGGGEPESPHPGSSQRARCRPSPSSRHRMFPMSTKLICRTREHPGSVGG
jgi:hypothetical protein